MVMLIRKDLINIPNILSAYRLLSVPVILCLIGFRVDQWVAILICINLVTDILDGFIARTFNLRTDFGARLDSLADIGNYLSAFTAVFVIKYNEVGWDFWGIYLFLSLYILVHVWSFLKFRKFPSLHLYSVKITGYLQGIYFFILFVNSHIPWVMWIAIGWGCVAWIEEFVVLTLLPEMRSDVGSVFKILAEREK